MTLHEPVLELTILVAKLQKLITEMEVSKTMALQALRENNKYHYEDAIRDVRIYVEKYEST